MSAIEAQVIDDSGFVRVSGFISPSPVYLLGPYTVGFATPGLTAGVPLGNPLPVGTVIYDIGVVTTTAWDGTTPKMDVGSFTSTEGIFAAYSVNPVDLATAYAAVTSNTTLSAAAAATSWLQAALGSAGAAGSSAYPATQLYATATTQLLAVVSQDGTQGGTATGASAGSSNVYVLAATPYSR